MSAPASETRFVERYQHVVDWLTLAVALVLVGIQVYLGLTGESNGDAASMRNLAIAAVIAAGVALYFTSQWRPALFLVGAVLVGGISVFWALETPLTLGLESSRVLAGATLFLLCIYQFFAQLLLYEREQGGTTTSTSE